MLAYYGTQLSPNQLETEEGFLICKNVPIARTGEQDYLAGEIGIDSENPNTVIKVYRYPNDVFDTAAMASFEGKTVTDEHPNELVTIDNIGNYDRGHLQNIRRLDDLLIGDLFITDPVLAGEIRSGAKREVSCGYTCNYIKDGENYKQANIRGNHIAVVTHGRAGSRVSIKDTAEEIAAVKTTQKGMIQMANLWKGILTAFAQATKDAKPEEIEELANTTAKVLEAEPENKSQDAEPTKDVDVIREPKGTDIGSKIDKILEKIDTIEKRLEEVEKKDVMSDEGKIDKAIDEMSTEESEEAITVPVEEINEDKCGISKDSKKMLLRSLKPAILNIKDSAERAAVTDSLLSYLNGKSNVMSDILKATTADRAASFKSNSEQIIEEQQNIYDSRNPHKMKGEN